MGYMDVPPEGAANGRTALLLHGKTSAPPPQDTIKALSKAGYRVIAPDQIGFAPPPNLRITSTASNSWRKTPTTCCRT